MPTNEDMLVSSFKEKVSIRSFFSLANMFSYVLMSANDLNNFWDQTILKWPLSGHFEFCSQSQIVCNIYLTQEMQNDWTMIIKQNLMPHTRITHEKFHTKKSKMAASRQFFFFYYFRNLA